MWCDDHVFKDVLRMKFTDVYVDDKAYSQYHFSFQSNKVERFSMKGKNSSIYINAKKIPGKLRASPVQHPATPALMTADAKV